MKKTQSGSKRITNSGCRTTMETGGPVTSCGWCNTHKAEPPQKKGWWARYVARLKKHEGDVRSCCR
ncbi:MAG: hypothetical protein K9N10_20020 [Deltaproteobacteria bacterium]|nr:hypothetical protein [Deltaproteobacteria bacterium]